MNENDGRNPSEDIYKPYKWICPKCGTTNPPQFAIYSARVYVPCYADSKGNLRIAYCNWHYEVDDAMPDSLEELLECTKCDSASYVDRIDDQGAVYEEILDED